MDLQIDRMESDNLIIAAVPQTMIHLIWDKVIPQLEKPIALSHGDATLESTKRKLITGEALLLTVSRGSEIVAISTAEVRVNASGLRSLYLPLIGGSGMDECIDRFLDIVKAIAKDFNCTELRGIAARKGWMRKLAPLGWSEVSTIIKCDVGE